ncbi:gluconokinase [Oryzicola mucosus]|uniref:Gluconokinase n=1 Tax=Oryzicola mucosus TaxID=2767425 RepID=A0A8J6PRG2_9HYPH|nr:gluconokinase [Oryzicola mucosus]MBD0416865.1 gluconokinase [Oryzicola mucosus]
MNWSVARQKVRLIVMGVSGSGKSTVGAALAGRLGVPFIEGDSLHSAANVEKMSLGIPLSDADRWPWLDDIAGIVRESESGVIISCSALKKAYRDRLREKGSSVLGFLFLAGEPGLLLQRLQSRSGHYMKATMLESQLAALEPPFGEPRVLIRTITEPLETTVSAAADWILAS